MWALSKSSNQVWPLQGNSDNWGLKRKWSQEEKRWRSLSCHLEGIFPMPILGVTFPSFEMNIDKDLGPEALYFAEFSKEVISKMTIARLSCDWTKRTSRSPNVLLAQNHTHTSRLKNPNFERHALELKQSSNSAFDDGFLSFENILARDVILSWKGTLAFPFFSNTSGPAIFIAAPLKQLQVNWYSLLVVLQAAKYLLVTTKDVKFKRWCDSRKCLIEIVSSLGAMDQEMVWL